MSDMPLDEQYEHLQNIIQFVHVRIRDAPASVYAHHIKSLDYLRALRDDIDKIRRKNAE